MAEKFKIAFDLDGVIVDKPPLIPKEVLEWLFRGRCRQEKLCFYFPQSGWEQSLRKLSHFYLFRPPIKENIDLIKKIAQDPCYEIYIVSGRYSFLSNETANWLKKRQIDNSWFKKIYINLTNEPPHLFKEKILRRIKADIFVDDNFPTIDYLRKKMPEGQFLLFQKGMTPALSQLLGLK